MTDAAIAQARRDCQTIEASARVVLADLNVAERDRALVVVRHAIALTKALEMWIVARADRATLVK
jgi:hypothetical protein